MIDHFETEDRIVCVVQRSFWSLREVIVECFPNGTVSYDATRMIIARVATSIGKMHSTRVVHRNICLNTIGMRISNSERCGYSVKRLSGMEYATCLKQK